MTIFDHFLMIMLFVVQPIAGWLSYRSYVKKIAAGEPADRLKLYRTTALTEWGFLTVLLVGWMVLARPLTALGFVAPEGIGFWIVAGAIVAGSFVMIRSVKGVKRLSQTKREKYRVSFGDLGHFMPRTRRELNSFYRLSFTAGVVEEIVFRGFTLWYLAAFMPLWSAVFISSVAFGFNHSYQGVGGMIRTGLAGLAFGALYVFSGSIWLPIVGHIIFDVLQGKQIREVYRDVDEPQSA